MTNDMNPVGYKKPPKHSQFKPGQSGNLKGRPKGTKNLATDLEEELSQKIIVTEGGKQQETTKQRAMLKSLFAKAMKGETRAASVILNLIIGLEQSRNDQADTENIDEEDMQILESYRERILADHKSEHKGDHNE
jgi:hypothetical protein